MRYDLIKLDQSSSKTCYGKERARWYIFRSSSGGENGGGAYFMVT